MALLISITPVISYGIILLLIGVGTRIFVGLRRFNRRGYGGAQLYTSYWSSVLVSNIEGVLMIISALSIVGGALLVLVELFNQH
ncbi:hypothetical protein [Dyadobacter arcticus]|uniref:Molybdenum ABC transporter permease n=1 Tax=Dyadobacter arcticus TaxID=1078754 RepID=A0ABX0UJ96_9BACT|nr:hypothetical protein [Dyadobacter arcticus]NIJ52169.1 hypothetical protein [Dyadobacter arcticus]